MHLDVTTPVHTGVGLRHAHYADALGCAQARQQAAFVEVHSENFFADGGAALQVLHAARERWPVSLHGVGLALGSAAGIDATHLDRLARLVERIDPVRVSDHAAFARAPRTPAGPVLHASDLLPCACTDASLQIMAANVQQVQDRLRRPLLVENLSSYLRWADDTRTEADFLVELARRTGCQLLVDVNNLVVNALNDHALDVDAAVRAACDWIDHVPPAVVAQLHLAGYTQADGLVIDDHGSRVHAPVWTVFDHALARFGARPTLLEWDTELPTWAELVDEAAAAERRIAAQVATADEVPA